MFVGHGRAHRKSRTEDGGRGFAVVDPRKSQIFVVLCCGREVAKGSKLYGLSLRYFLSGLRDVVAIVFFGVICGIRTITGGSRAE